MTVDPSFLFPLPRQFLLLPFLPLSFLSSHLSVSFPLSILFFFSFPLSLFPLELQQAPYKLQSEERSREQC